MSHKILVGDVRDKLLDISGKYVKTRFVLTSPLHLQDIKDPGVALTTLGVTEPKRRRFDV